MVKHVLVSMLLAFGTYCSIGLEIRSEEELATILIANFKNVYDSVYKKEPIFTRDQVEYLATAFRSIPVQGSILGNLIEESLETSNDDFVEFEDHIDDLMNNEEFMDRVKEDIVKYLLERQTVKDELEKYLLEHNDLESSGEDNDEQVGGWTGCKRDYDALVEPITVPLMKILMFVLGIPGGDEIPGRDAQDFGGPSKLHI